MCVAEKPSVARTACSILSGGSSRAETTKDKYVKNFYFGGSFNGEEVEIVFTSVLGHLLNKRFPDAYSDWARTDPSELFKCQILTEVPKEMKAVESNLVKLAKKAKYLQLWLDNDREGEFISEEVEQVCKQANPRLAVSRARFSALSPADLWNALRHPTEINRCDARAVELRQELDLRIGVIFTRWQTLRYRNYKTDPSSPISYGPCQFPTLGFIVDAYVNHENFTPEKFWLLNCTVKKNNKPVELKWCRKRLFCKLSCFAIYASTLDDPTVKVLNVAEKRTVKFKPLPLATVEFQRRASKYLKIEPQKAMEIAEKLYSQGFISYPRTETDSFPDNFEFIPIIRQLIDDPDVGQYARSLEQRFENPRKGKHSDNAHPPIYPIKVLTGEHTADERKVFKFIAQHFLACCSKDAIGMETLVMFDVGGESFKLKGLRIAERNWLDVYPYIPWSGKEIPKFTVGETMQPTALTMNEGETTAPPLLTEPDLIKKMDQEGIGTDATIAEHISKIQSRGYCQKVGNVFYPCQMGLALVLGYEAMGFDFAKPTLRANMERSMNQVSAGEVDWKRERVRYINEYQDAFDRIQRCAFLLDRSFQAEMSKPAPAPQPEAAPTRARRGASTGTRARGRGARGGSTARRGE